MFTETIEPRFSDSDALGHISNTTFPIWFEGARTPIFRIFHPTLAIHNWPLILARLEIDYLDQTYLDSSVDVITYVGKLGKSSCHIIQEAWQKNNKVAQGLSVMIYYNYETKLSQAIPEEIREQLSLHLQKKV